MVWLSPPRGTARYSPEKLGFIPESRLNPPPLRDLHLGPGGLQTGFSRERLAKGIVERQAALNIHELVRQRGGLLLRP